MDERIRIDEAEPAGIRPGSFAVRLVTALGYGIVVLGSLWLGPLAAGVVFGVMSGLCAAEFYAMERRESRLPNEVFGVIAATVMPLAAAFWGLTGLSATLTALVAASLVWHIGFRRTRTADTAITVFGAAYTGFLLAYLVLIIEDFSAGRWLAMLVVFSVWVNDVAAYFFGSLLGRHKLAPSISPKKSWEGFIAGSLGSIAMWAAAPLVPVLNINWLQAVLTGIGVAFAATIGDLAESRMKREAGVKDSGKGLPGHGGYLDRLDSMIFVCLVAYWVLWWTGVR